MRVRNGGRARCPHRAANPHEMPKAPRGDARWDTGGAHAPRDAPRGGVATGHEWCARTRDDAAR